MGRAGEDHGAIAQSSCQGLGAPLGAAGSQHMAQRFQLPLDSRLNQLCAPSQERSSLLLNKRVVVPGFSREAPAQESLAGTCW